MNFDDILEYLGEFGWYQKRLYFILCIPAITGGFHAFAPVFIIALPDHRCAIPGLQNDTYAIQNDYHQWLINQTIPNTKEGYERCKVHPYGPDNRTDCDRWVFDKSVFLTTSTEEMSLVCGDLIRRSHLNMLKQGGIMFASLVLGNMGDLFGRKKILFFSILGSLVVGIATVWVPEFISFSFARFLIGIFGAGYFLNAFTLGMEFVSPEKRMWTGMIIEVFFAIGGAILAIAAYFIRDWRYLQLAISVPSIFYIAYLWLIPESPRWLLTNGRTEEAEKIIRHAAKVNKVILPKEMFSSKLDDDHVTKVKIWELFSHRTLLIRSLIIFLNWCVVSMVYYGLSLNSAYLYGGVHLNFLLSVVVEVIGYALCFPLLDRIGRRVLHASCMIVGGVACCCTIFTVLYLAEEYQAVTTALALIGKLGASAGFAVIYLFSSELFPTVVRNGGTGMSSMVARVGSMSSPYIADLGQLVGGSFGTALPLLVFGGFSLAAGIASLWLPETNKRKLPESILDAINFGKQNKEGKDIAYPYEKNTDKGEARTIKYDNSALEVDTYM